MSRRVLADPGSGLPRGGVGGRGAAAAAGGGGVDEDAERRAVRSVADHNAILGPVPDLPRFVLANGFSGHGMQHAPAVGRAISEVIADGESRTLDISAFSVARFAEGTGFPRAT